MFRKLSILAAMLSVTACSSYTATSDYDTDVIVSKNQQENHQQIVGKEIIPVDLIERNLALKISILSVTANVAASGQQDIDSEVNFKIQYVQPKSTDAEQKKYDFVTVNKQQADLKTLDISNDCGDNSCTVTQDVSFVVATNLLQSCLEHGLQFSLQQQDGQKSELETLIPGRYLSALLTK